MLENLIMFFIYIFLGFFFALMNCVMRSDMKLPPNKGWRFLLMSLTWPIWFMIWFIINSLRGFWHFLWSDIQP